MKLTNAEFTDLFNGALCEFADHCNDELNREIIGHAPSTKRLGNDRMWLWVYALNTWDNTAGALNFLTEQQMLRIVSRVQQHKDYAV